MGYFIRRKAMPFFLSLALVCLFSANTFAAVITIDFSTEDDLVTPLVDGQEVTSPPEFGTHFNISTSGTQHVEAAIFDSSVGGPNDPSGDNDLLVGLGNVLILQSKDSPSKTGDIFDTPNDEAGGGTIIFDFINPVTMLSVDLIDIDRNGPATVTLFDGGGDTRTYSAPISWTKDVASDGPDGYDTLDLTTLLAQDGEGPGGSATAAEVGVFNADDVVQVQVYFDGSAAMDNLVFETGNGDITQVPEPGTLALVGLGIASLGRRVVRKRKSS